jgi:hypothetical protein
MQKLAIPAYLEDSVNSFDRLQTGFGALKLDYSAWQHRLPS